MTKEEEKREEINDFLLDLKEFISTKAQDIVDSTGADCWDSMVGMSSYESECKLEKSLYKLFGIEIGDDDADEDNA